MHHSRQTAIAAGGLFLLAAFASIIAVLLYDPILSNPEFILKSSQHLHIRWGVVLEVVAALAVIGTSLALYPVLKEYNERMALTTVAFRVAEALVILIGTMCLLSILTLSHDAPSDPASNIATAQTLVAFRNWTFLFGPNILLGPSTLITAYILYRTKLVPRLVSLAGLVGGPMIFLCGIMVTLGLFEQLSIPGALMAIPVFGYEMCLAVYLIARGFNLHEVTVLPEHNLFKLSGTTTQTYSPNRMQHSDDISTMTTHRK